MLEIVLTLAGIAVPAVLLAVAVNRWLAPVSPRLILLLLALVLATVHLGVFTSRMPVPLDEVMRGYPYRGFVEVAEARNPVTNDTVKQMLPWMQVAREELFAGRAPLWNRYSFSGYPLLGNAQSAPLSPFFLATLFVPLPKQIVAMAGLKLFVALLFGVLFLREEGAGVAAALAGSMVFAFSVIQNVYLYYPMSAVTCLLPALAWAVVRSVRRGEARDLVALALVTAAAFASGHPESVLHLAIAAVIVMMIEVARRASSLRASGLTVAFAFAGALLAAAAWIPAGEQILASQRMDALAGGEVESPAFPGQAAWAAIHPDGFGNPARGTWRWIFNYPMVASTFVGLIPLMLLPGALLAAAADARTRLHALAAVALFLVAMRWTLAGELFNALPLLSSAANDRLRFVVVFFVAVATARRLEQVARRGPSLADLAAGLVLLLLAVYVHLKLALVTIERGHVALVAMLAIFLAACLSAALSLWRNWRLEGAVPIPVVAALFIGIELFLVNLPYNALTPREYFAPELPIVQAMRSAAPEEPWRFLGADWALLPNASAHYGVEDVRGSDPMAWAPYTRFFERVQAEGQSLDVLRAQHAGDSAIDFLNVRFLVTDPGFGAGPGWRKVYSGADGDLFENEEWVRRFFAPARLLPDMTHDARDVEDLSTTAVVDDPDLESPVENTVPVAMWMQQMSTTSFRLTIDSSARAFVASSQPALPGWTVEIDGAPVPVWRVNGAFIGFWVPEGTSKVRVSYEPRSWQLGIAMSLIGAMLLAAGARMIGANRRRSRSPRLSPSMEQPDEASTDDERRSRRELRGERLA